VGQSQREAGKVAGAEASSATAADVEAAGRSLTLGLLHSLNVGALSFEEMHAYVGPLYQVIPPSSPPLPSPLPSLSCTRLRGSTVSGRDHSIANPYQRNS
jgi:hypothetical protein